MWWPSAHASLELSIPVWALPSIAWAAGMSGGKRSWGMLYERTGYAGSAQEG
jgi:hypothetical protein